MATTSAPVFSGADGTEPGVALEYVSMRCPQGDITLKLRLDSSFLLELRYWDKEEHRHTHCEEASGTRDYDYGILTLKGESKVVYRRDKILFRWGESGILVGVDALLWVSSTQSMFADSFELFEKSAVDHLVERAAFMPLFPAVSVSFGDTVRIRATPATESLDLAGLVGQVFGETVPSSSGVEVIGELTSDDAVSVYFEERQDQFWFALDLVEFIRHAPESGITSAGAPVN